MASLNTNKAIVFVLNSYHTIMIWPIDEPVIARADDSLIRPETETKLLCFILNEDMTRSLFIITLEFPLETMCQVAILNLALSFWISYSRWIEASV
ncbi:hypothetical protein ACFLUY_00740 [Chloroflexota bacterium]